MAITLTYTDICNMAIDWCGGSLSISDIDDEQNPDAIVCKRNLGQAIVSELDKYEWEFARRMVKALEDTLEKNKIEGYHCYVLPNDFSRLSMYFIDMYDQHGIVNEYNNEPSYFVRGGLLYTRRPIEYIFYNTNSVPIREWHSLFADCVALNLAERICGKIKGMDADISFFNKLYKDKLKDARRLELIQTESMQGGRSYLQAIRRMP